MEARFYLWSLSLLIHIWQAVSVCKNAFAIQQNLLFELRLDLLQFNIWQMLNRLNYWNYCNGGRGLRVRGLLIESNMTQKFRRLKRRGTLSGSELRVVCSKQAHVESFNRTALSDYCTATNSKERVSARQEWLFSAGWKKKKHHQGPFKEDWPMTQQAAMPQWRVLWPTPWPPHQINDY